MRASNDTSDERAELPPVEEILLWSIRAWVLARIRPEVIDVEGRIATALDRLDAPEAGCGLCRFMEAVERGGTRAVIVERMCARSLTSDERTLLGIFACAGAGRAGDAVRALRDLVAAGAVGPALERALDVAHALADAGHAFRDVPPVADSAVTVH